MKTPWNLVFVAYLVLMIVTIFKIGDLYFLIASILASVYILKKFEGARRADGAGNALVLLGLMLLPLPAFLLGGKENALPIVAVTLIVFGIYAFIRGLFRIMYSETYRGLAEKANGVIVPLDRILFENKD